MADPKKSKVDVEDPIGEAMSPGELAEYTREAELGESLEAYQEEGVLRYAAEVSLGASLEEYMEADIRAYTGTSGYAEPAESYDGPDVSPDYSVIGDEDVKSDAAEPVSTVEVETQD